MSNPTGKGGVRIVAGKPPERKPIDESLTWEIALERLRQEAREAIVGKRRSLSKRLEIARALQILEAAASKPQPEEDEDAWQQDIIKQVEAKRQAKQEGD